MTTSNGSEYRRQVRAQLEYFTPCDRNGKPKCWGCGRSDRRLDMHEMVNRGATMGNEEARLLSFGFYVTVLLCSDCHYLAPTTTMQEKLWQALIKAHGYEAVSKAVQEIVNVMGSKPLINFPREPDGIRYSGTNERDGTLSDHCEA